MIKKISLIVSFSVILVFSACSGINGNKNDRNPSENTEGAVVKMTADMFKQQIWDYEKSPGDFKFKGDQPCVIDFYADWCRPCKMVAPVMEELAAEYKGKVRIYKVNTDEEGELSQVFNIRSIPAILYIPKAGKPSMTVGFAGKENFEKTIRETLLNDTIHK